MASKPAQSIANPQDVVYVKTKIVACDGGGGALGHPLVYLELKDGQAKCGYCDKIFLADGALDDSH